MESCWVWGDTPVVLALRRWSQGDGGVKASLDYTVSLRAVLATIHIDNVSQQQKRETKPNEQEQSLLLCYLVSQ